ncbi:SNF1 protein kinase subunit beta-3 [Elsinoe fawcettii]|nr:SNF1 protein kinase subunit beta-3 [Elsinoe fawcettii]
MGNSPSTSQKQAPAGHTKSNDVPPRREPKRRESVHALPSTNSKATPAPPSASLESAIGVQANSPTQARDIRPSHSRNRSATIATPHLKPQDQLEKAMGNDSSKPKRTASRSSTSRTPPAPPAEVQTASPADKPATPVDDSEPVFEPSPLDPTAPATDAYSLPAASYNRPPRLPLPIENENYTPGSPILSPVNETADLPAVDGIDSEPEAAVNRRTSVVSSNQDEDDDDDEYEYEESDPNAPTAPYTVEWKRAKPGDKVYVTGSFANWNKKFRLHPSSSNKPGEPYIVSLTIQLRPGIYHVKFLVNNDMQTSRDMPTTVDYGNILVNYIEISAEDVAKHQPKPVAVPAPSKPMDIRPKQTTDAASPVKTSSPAPKQVATPSPSQTPARASPRPTKTPPVRKSSPKEYSNEIPQYLLDLDHWPSETPDSSPDSIKDRNLERAKAAADSQPTPPSLPLFLNKSVLNASTPLKDDASVLAQPNHTVLNHLATTNIKHGVLATSATTRYKTRFLTTIMYKPRNSDD